MSMEIPLEIPLLHLLQWFEDNVERTSTLAIVRRVVQGFFPLMPTSQVDSLGKSRSLRESIELLRKNLGIRDFEEFVACQCEGYKQSRSATGEGFYVGYLIGATAIHNVEMFAVKFNERRYRAQRSEVYRNCYPMECHILMEYFRRFVLGEDVDYQELRKSFASQPPTQPIWVYYTFTHDEAKAVSEEVDDLWTSGKVRVASKKLGVDKEEVRRAAIEALVDTSLQFSPIAEEFMVSPDDDEFPLPYQVAFQFRERKDDFLKNAPPFSVTLDTVKI